MEEIVYYMLSLYTNFYNESITLESKFEGPSRKREHKYKKVFILIIGKS